jgi:hypothetical protein
MIRKAVEFVHPQSEIQVILKKRNNYNNDMVIKPGYLSLKVPAFFCLRIREKSGYSLEALKV